MAMIKGKEYVSREYDTELPAQRYLIESEDGNSYIVLISKTPDVNHACTCKSYEFSGKCKHITHFSNEED